ncbi:MAG: hypothetical protein K8S21_01620 [Gemmatimonadetes bacterium]|nr:hypothetical protein [Gemmatimonadota bacterium]
MQRHLRLAASLGLVLLAAACSDIPTAAPEAQLQQVDVSSSIVAGTCTNLVQLNALAAQIFTRESSPNINSVLGKLKELDKLVKKGKIREAKRQAAEIVAFTLKKSKKKGRGRDRDRDRDRDRERENEGGLGGTPAQLKAFTNAVLCFAGIDIEVVLPANSFLVMPADTQQVLTDTTGNIGVQFPADPVAEPTLITFAVVPDTFTQPGGGPLDTKLDQYPGFIVITKTSESNAPLSKPVVVGVCATGAIPQIVRDRLRLGHGASTGFEVTPSASADFIQCPNLVADAGPAPLWQRLASALLPQQLHAFQNESFGGGVGGTVTEFSPFAPVDPQLEFGGGVGGTVTEFIRVPAPGVPTPRKKGTPLNRPSIVADPCAAATVGSTVTPACEPFIVVRTRMGTLLENVPVTWSVTGGNGSVAGRSGTCGSFGANAISLTGVNGRAGACWTLGTTAGLNTIRATPGAGGDAPDGVVFVPASRDFSMTGTADVPANLEIVQGDPQFDQTPFVAVAIPPVVRLTDRFGNAVSGERITWNPFPSSIGGGGSASPLESFTDADGRASTIWVIGDGYNHMWAYLFVGETKLYVDFRALTDH